MTVPIKTGVERDALAPHTRFGWAAAGRGGGKARGKRRGQVPPMARFMS